MRRTRLTRPLALSRPLIFDNTLKFRFAHLTSAAGDNDKHPLSSYLCRAHSHRPISTNLLILVSNNHQLFLQFRAFLKKKKKKKVTVKNIIADV